MGRFAFFFVGILSLVSSAWSFPAKFSVSPDSSQEMFVQAIVDAKSSIVINVYMFTSPKLQDLLIQKMQEGISVKLLVESEPFGRMYPSQKKVLDNLANAMRSVRGVKNKLYVVSSRGKTVERRYVYDHAKYAVIDGKKAYVSSENLVGSGVMSNPNSKGNRGWQILLQDPETAETLLEFFNQDVDPKNADVMEYEPGIFSILIGMSPVEATGAPPVTKQDRTAKNIPMAEGDVRSATFCASPRSITCIEDFIQSAQKTLDIQHLSLPAEWSIKGGKKILNPILDAALGAAKRGVRVRILLNRDGSEEEGVVANGAVFGNSGTIELVKRIAKEQSLPISAEFINAQAVQVTILHNKGMVADGDKAFISSINGTRNSVEKNREMAVAVESPAAGSYYGKVFQSDWEKSE